MAELLRAFRFRIKLRKSATGGGGVGLSAAGQLSVGAGASLAAGPTFQADAGPGPGASLTAGASLGASATAGISAAVGVGEAPGELLGDGGFQECSGLEIEMDVQEFLEGGRNASVVRRVGRAKYQNLVLKRGMLYSGARVRRELWVWIQSVTSGVRPVVRYDGVVEVMSGGEDVVARWEFERGLPVRVRGPELNARTGEIAIEELHIAHEGLRLSE